MQRKIFKSDQTRWGRTRTCSICRMTVKRDEEVLYHSGAYDGNAVYWHRPCMDKWLTKNPPYKKAKPPTVSQREIDAAEAEKEFERIRRSLLRKARAEAKTTAKK